MVSSARMTWASSSGSFASQPRCGSRRTRAPLAPPRLSLPRKEEAEAQAAETSCATVRSVASTCSLSAAISAASSGSPVRAGSGSCHSSTSEGTSGPR